MLVPPTLSTGIVFFEIAEDSDVRQSESCPTAQGNPDRWPIRIAMLLGYGTGRDKKPTAIPQARIL